LPPAATRSLTGFFRDRLLRHARAEGWRTWFLHQGDREFLEFSRSRGNDLSRRRPEMRFKGLQPGDRWCLHVLRWVEARKAGTAPQVVLDPLTKTSSSTSPRALKGHALDLH